MAPYISWAKQYRSQKKDDSYRAGWLLSLYTPIMTKLHSKLFDENIRFNDLEKAQLFIGYLAEFPKNEKDKEA
jgi:hypothetical protein